MAQETTPTKEQTKPYRCVYGITTPHPELGDGTKTVDARCLHHRPGSVVLLTEKQAAPLLKQRAVEPHFQP